MLAWARRRWASGSKWGLLQSRKLSTERSAAVRLFERHKFIHGRTRQLHGKDTLYFYLDLYAQGDDEVPTAPR